MNRRLFWLLGVALLATAGMALMGDPADDSDALLAEPATGRVRAADAPGAVGTPVAPVPRGGVSARAAATEAPPEIGPAMHAALTAWQARLAAPPQPAGRMSLAWGPAEPPPPPPVRSMAPSEAAPPQAPRFPHQWVGRFNDEPVASESAASGVSGDVVATQRVVLQGGQGVWVAREGDVIEGVWRVDRIRERALQLTYLPLAQSQSVTMR